MLGLRVSLVFVNWVNSKGNNEKVRFLCVNTPESIHPDRKQNIPKGKIASDYAKYGLNLKYDQEFRKAERHARNHKLGIWGDPKLTKNYLRLKSKWGQYRSQTNAQPNTVQPKE